MSNPINDILKRWASWGRRRSKKEYSNTSLCVTRLEDRLTPAFHGGTSVASGDWNNDGFTDIATGAGPSGGPHVKVFSGATGEEIVGFFAYAPTFTGGVKVAMGDVTGDGQLDLITGAGSGGGPHLKVFDGKSLALVFEVMAYDISFTGGVTVAAADLDGDGRAELITGAMAGGGPHVRAFSVLSGALIQEFMAFDVGFTGGASVAAGDVTGDGVPEIIVGAGAGGLSEVVAVTTSGMELSRFRAYEQEFTGGVHVAVGDVNGDGIDEIITGAGSSGGPRVRTFLANGQEHPSPLGSFWAYSQDFDGGVLVAAADLDADGRDDLVTGAGSRGGPHVRAFRAVDTTELASFMAYAPDTRHGGFSRRRSISPPTAVVPPIVSSPPTGVVPPISSSPPVVGPPPPFVNTPPVVSRISDQSLVLGTPTDPLSFTVTDAETTADKLLVTVSSDNTTLLPATGLFVSGTGTLRSLVVTPSLGQFGNGRVTLTVRDPQGLTASTTFTVAVTEPLVSNQSVSTADFRAATQFLYTGPGAVQTGMAPGTIDAMRAAVVRGRVLSLNGQPLPGVTVTVLNSSQYGQTVTRADGYYDLAVNGGGSLVIEYAKAGYLPIQRRTDTPWRDFAVVDDVALTPLDSAVTAIDLTSPTTPIQVARGNVVTDEDGTRQATLFFPQGTTATMTLPNGTVQPLTTLSVRATEYTVGDTGPMAMPGTLPPTSGYTYAVELSVDEAMTAGASEVMFSQPVPFYVENFLNFPVGMAVPAGYYDRERGVWVPSDNGRVIQVLSVAGGVASVDGDGDGDADTSAELAALGVTNAELVQLGTTYQVGANLWRVPVAHFTPWDWNWPFGPPDDVIEPRLRDREVTPDHQQDQSEDCGSIILVESQLLGERASLSGSEFNLTYVSNNQRGYTGETTLSIPISPARIPEYLKRIEASVTIAGKVYSASFAPELGKIWNFNWEGTDAYGRAVTGWQRATVELTYVYGLVRYQTPAELARAFGAYGTSVLGVNRQNAEMTLTTNLQLDLPGQTVVETEIGGWGLDIHHRYDPVARRLITGDGQVRSVGNVNQDVVRRFAGTGVEGYSGNGGRALDAEFDWIGDVEIGPDGSVYVWDTDRHTLRRIDPDGTVWHFAGTGQIGFGGDGGPAANATFGRSVQFEIASDSTIYIADSDNRRIRAISPDGIIQTIAGNGLLGMPILEGAVAKDNAIYPRGDIALSPSGSIYYTGDNQRIREIRSDGRVVTVAGNGDFPPIDPSADGIDARSTALVDPHGVEIGDDGTIYFIDLHLIRKVDEQGKIRTIAGGGDDSTGHDGLIARNVRFSEPDYVVVDSSGNLYTTGGSTSFELYDPRIRIIRPDGLIDTVAGKRLDSTTLPEVFLHRDDGAYARVAELGGLFTAEGLTIGPDGILYIYAQGYIRTIEPFFSEFTDGSIVIASESGQELYRFSSTGTHLQTLDVLTGTPLYTFGYDSAGRLVTVTDADGDITRIERTTAGNPFAIITQDGQRTTLGLNSDGYLSRVTNPAGESHRFAYAEGGLLTRFTDPLGNSSRFTYDDLGRLIRNEDAAGGFTELRREELGRGNYKVTTTNAVGRVQQYLVEYQPDGSLKRTTIDARGFRTVTTIGTDGTRTTTSPDGTVATTKYGPDPRFGMQSPVVTSQTIRTPSGLTSTMTGSRTATFATPSNPTSALVTLTDTVTINSETFTTVYTAATRTYTTTSAEGRTTSTVTDEKGRVVRAEVPGVTPTTYAYDSRGRLASVSQGNRTVTYTYNAQGYLASITDPLNRTTQLDYDAVGRITRQVQPDGSEIRFRYDLEGKMVGLTPPGQPEHTFEYNSRDLVTETDPPFAFAGDDTTNYTYNLAKQLTREVLPNGTVIDYAYCACGRPTDITTPWGNYAYTYSSTTGQLTNVTGPGGFALNTGYDGILVTSEEMTGPVAGQVNWTYDQNFRVTSESVNGGNTVALAYDGDGLLTRSGDLTVARDAQNGRVTGSTLGTITDTVNYDTFGDRSGYRANIGVAVGLEYTFTRDQLGRITRKVETTNGVTTTTDYGYDLKGQLTTVTVNGVLQQTYAYDPNGNRLSLTTPSGTETGVYDAQDRLLSYGTKAYTYSADGSLRSVTDSATGQTTTYTYDGFGNLTRVDLPDSRVIEYLIDPDNRRVGKKVNGVLSFGLVYNGQLTPAAMVDASGSVVARFVYATGVNVPEYMLKGGVTYRLITDHLGSVRMVVNAATGEVVQRLDYDAFGRVTQDTNQGFQPFGYAGGLYDADTGLVRFGARDFSSSSGSWTTRDPISFSGRQTGLYSYVGNDPVNFIDMRGTDRVSTELPPGFLDAIRNIAVNSPGLKESVEAGGNYKNYPFPGFFGNAEQNAKSILDDIRDGRNPFGKNSRTKDDNKYRCEGIKNEFTKAFDEEAIKGIPGAVGADAKWDGSHWTPRIKLQDGRTVHVDFWPTRDILNPRITIVPQ
jgi:RHS repeat-associated protein